MGLFRAAADKIDLAPPVGTWMTGFGSRIEPSTGTHDPITARAVLLDDGDRRLAIVSCDLLGFEPGATVEMRGRIAELSAIPAQSTLICCTHTHSGPASMEMRGAMGHVDSAWLAEAQSRIVELVAGLPARLMPARLAWGSGQVSGVGYNRQDQSRPVDEEIVVMSVETEDGAAIATMANYATHAVVLGYKNLMFSADFPGALTRRLEERRGGVALYLQGACGDVDPVIHRDRGWGTGTFDDAEEIGERLAGAAAEALANAARTRGCALRSSRKVVQVPLDPPPSRGALGKMKAEFEADRERALAEPKDPAQAEIVAAMLQWAGELDSALCDGRVPEHLPVEISAAAINDVRLVGLPSETYADIGMRIKEGLKPLKGVFVGYANGLHGYLASRWAKEQGGYGPDHACRWFSGLLTPIGTGADELLVQACAAMAKSL